MAKAITTYEIVLTVAGKTVALPMTSERKTRSVLVQAAGEFRDVLLSTIPESDLMADTAYRAGALCFGGSLLHFRAV